MRLAETGNVIEGNLIGTDISGSIALGNTGEGIVIAYAQSNTIGGTAAGEGNVISGNVYGINILDGASDILVAGNLIGVSSDGTAAIANSLDGIILQGATTGDTIGGNSAGTGNVISGNASAGVEISGSGTTGNVVAGNLIGTGSTGTVAIANDSGVKIDSGASGNLIGTNGDGVNDALERNVISGNSLVGIWITGTGTNNNVVAGDYVGTDYTGSVALPNRTSPVNTPKTDLTSVGIVINSGAPATGSGPTGPTRIPPASNIISGNNSDGIEIDGSGSSGNLVAGNYIGLAASGTAALGNNQAGILLSTGTRRTRSAESPPRSETSSAATAIGACTLTLRRDRARRRRKT